VKFETSEFILDVPGDWREFPGDYPEQFSFHWEEFGASIVVSYLFAAIPREKMLEAAQTVLDSRLNTLDELGPHRIDESYAEVLEDEPLAHSKQIGQTGTGIYRFEGWVTEAKFINIWVGVEGDDIGRAARVFDSVFAGFSFYIP
jgi:hypothetical protein